MPVNPSSQPPLSPVSLPPIPKYIECKLYVFTIYTISLLSVKITPNNIINGKSLPLML